MVLSSIHRLHKSLHTKSAAFVSNSVSLSSAALLKPKLAHPGDETAAKGCTFMLYSSGSFFISPLSIPPEESDEVSVFFIDEELMKHHFYITGHGYPLLAETAEDTC